MERVFDITPMGNVKISYSWNSKEIQFESNKYQYLRRRVRPKKTYSFTVAGLDLKKLVTLYNDCHGLAGSFSFTYDGVTEECHFAQAINPTVKREGGKIIAYECEVSLEVVTQKKKYGVPSESDVLPTVYSDTSQSFDWKTKTVNMGQATKYRTMGKEPVRKISGLWCGLKDERDRLIDLFNSHCKMPLKFNFNGEVLNVRFPDRLDIIDHRELKDIVGYECQMELEVVSGA